MSRTTSVNLRQKSISNGRLGLVLDFYPAIISSKTGKKTRREFLGIYIKENPKTVTERKNRNEKLKQANAYRTEIELQIINGTYGKQKIEDTNIDFLKYFDDFVESHKDKKANTYNCIKSAYLRFCDFCNNELHINEVNKALVEKYRTYLGNAKNFKTGKPISHNSKSTYFSKFRSVILKAYQDGILKTNPLVHVKGVGLIQSEREFLTIDELGMLIKTPTPYENDNLFEVVKFAVYTGMRFSDIQKLKWSEIQYSDVLKHHIKFTQKKTSDKNSFTIPNHIYKLLGERRGNEDLVFDKLQGKCTFNRKLKIWTQAAGIDKHITAHCLRHTFATLQIANKTDIFTVSKLLGHKNIKTTQIYAHIMDEAKVEAANAIPVI